MKMKRNLALILSSAMFLSMAGCGSNDVSAQKEEGGQSAVAQGRLRMLRLILKDRRHRTLVV